jgi:hypothetical protein
MKKIYYEKVGRRYVPVAEYDNELLDSFPKGTHLVMCYPGGSSRRFNIDPNYAAMIAAGRVAEDSMCRAMVKASELKPQRTPITPEQKASWEALAQSFGSELCTLHGASVHDIVEAGVKAMQDEADKLMQHESVRKAYEHFLLMCELTRNKSDRELI